MKPRLLCFLLILPFQAHALLINSSVGAYDVTTISTTGNDPILGGQVWWDKDALALEFAGLVNDDLGTNGVFGPRFAIGIRSVVTITSAAWDVAGQFAYKSADFRSLESVYAVASPAPTGVPEPGTLSLFGAGLLALGFLRRRRAA